MSPTPATDTPNLSSGSTACPLIASQPNLSMRPAVPSGFMSMTYTAPMSDPAGASYGAPTAMSGMPSMLTSPMPATDLPNSADDAPSSKLRGAAAAAASDPIGAASPSRSTMCMVPAAVPVPVRVPPRNAAPTAKSGTPLPS